MRRYDPSSPLIALHIPKTGGLAVRDAFRQWFGEGLLPHYPNPRDGLPPPRHDLAAISGRPVAVYGHFNRRRGFGADQYYPGVEQFTAILRDPFERAVSAYFYLRANAAGKKDRSRVPPPSLDEHLRTTTASFLDHFPRPVDAGNWRAMLDTYFIAIGVTEHLDESLRRIAAALGRPPPATLARINATPRDQPVSAAQREAFVERHPLEYAVYRHVLERFR